MKTELAGKIYGSIQGRRVYKVKRGHYQIQATRPQFSQFDGTLRECEKALGGKLVRLY